MLAPTLNQSLEEIEEGDVATLKRNFDVQFYLFREISTRLALVSRIATLARIGESLSLLQAEGRAACNSRLFVQLLTSFQTGCSWRVVPIVKAN